MPTERVQTEQLASECQCVTVCHTYTCIDEDLPNQNMATTLVVELWKTHITM